MRVSSACASSNSGNAAPPSIAAASSSRAASDSPFSIRAMIVRGSATPDPFSVWTNSSDVPGAWSVLNAPASRTRRAISWAYWLPKSRMGMTSACGSGSAVS